mgnify:CR=1 FL=1
MNNSKFNCPNCGSNDLLLMTSYTCKCHHCGSVFNVKRDVSQKNNVVTKIITDEKETFLAMPKNGDIMDFVKSAFETLYTDDYTSVKTVNAVFSPAYEEVSVFGVVLADYFLSYSADIGYDRAETYYVTETYYVNGRPNYRQVARTRVVTDWHPISSTYFGGNISTCCKIDNNEGIYDVATEEDRFTEIYKQELCIPVNSASYSISPFHATDDMLAGAIAVGEDIASNQCLNSLPGDHVRNFSYTATHSVKKIYNVSKLDYVLPYSIGDQNYAIRGCSFNNVPHLDYSPKEDVSKNIKKQTAKVFAPLLFLPLILLIAGAIALSIIYDMFYMFAVPAGYLLIVSIIWAAVNSNKIKKTKEINMRLKKEKLDKMLSDYSLS